MHKSDFDYHLPDELIAHYPLPDRTASRLLVLHDEGVQDQRFHALPTLLQANDLLVLNDTRVIPARLYAQKPTGGRVELLIERILNRGSAWVLLKSSKKPKPGSRLLFENDITCTIQGRDDDLFLLNFAPRSVMEVLDDIGHVPLPPYIEREDEASDVERYQTVFSKQPGAVAAPTAGLHFDQALLAQLAEQGVQQAHLTLHVGSGTFLPVRVDDLDQHVMHREWLSVSEALVELVHDTKAKGGRVIAVGTTVVRALETAAQHGTLQPFEGDTQLFIRPGFQFKVVDALITNFHLPQSTLMMLVCAFGGYDKMMAAYQHAVTQQYRFFSYGDAMFIPRHPSDALVDAS